MAGPWLVVSKAFWFLRYASHRLSDMELSLKLWHFTDVLKLKTNVINSKQTDFHTMAVPAMKTNTLDKYCMITHRLYKEMSMIFHDLENTQLYRTMLQTHTHWNTFLNRTSQHQNGHGVRRQMQIAQNRNVLFDFVGIEIGRCLTIRWLS